MQQLPLDILFIAFVAGLLVLLTHIPLGLQVLRRGIIFIDLAIAQAAATGVLLAELFFQLHGFGGEMIAFSCALSAGALLFLIEKTLPEIQEAMIGGLFVVLACIGILLTAGNPQGSEHLQSILAGQILWTDSHALWKLAISSIAAVSMMLVFNHPLWKFYLPFAIAITASVQAVGVYLVFSSLIFPALAVLRIDNKRLALIPAFAIGLCGYLGGLVLSLLADWPSGPAIVCTLALLSLLSGALIHKLRPRQA